jgi:hypothetical protein
LANPSSLGEDIASRISFAEEQGQLERERGQLEQCPMEVEVEGFEEGTDEEAPRQNASNASAAAAAAAASDMASRLSPADLLMRSTSTNLQLSTELTTSPLRPASASSSSASPYAGSDEDAPSPSSLEPSYPEASSLTPLARLVELLLSAEPGLAHEVSDGQDRSLPLHFAASLGDADVARLVLDKVRIEKKGGSDERPSFALLLLGFRPHIWPSGAPATAAPLEIPRAFAFPIRLCVLS